MLNKEEFISLYINATDEARQAVDEILNKYRMEQNNTDKAEVNGYEL